MVSTIIRYIHQAISHTYDIIIILIYNENSSSQEDAWAVCTHINMVFPSNSIARLAAPIRLSSFIKQLFIYLLFCDTYKKNAILHILLSYRYISIMIRMLSETMSQLFPIYFAKRLIVIKKNCVIFTVSICTHSLLQKVL